jgi:hypothetical protein
MGAPAKGETDGDQPEQVSVREDVVRVRGDRLGALHLRRAVRVQEDVPVRGRVRLRDREVGIGMSAEARLR